MGRGVGVLDDVMMTAADVQHGAIENHRCIAATCPLWAGGGGTPPTPFVFVPVSSIAADLSPYTVCDACDLLLPLPVSRSDSHSSVGIHSPCLPTQSCQLFLATVGWFGIHFMK